MLRLGIQVAAAAAARVAQLAAMIAASAPAASTSFPPLNYAPPALDFDCLTFDGGEKHRDECQDAPTKEKE